MYRSNSLAFVELETALQSVSVPWLCSGSRKNKRGNYYTEAKGVSSYIPSIFAVLFAAS